MPSDSVVDQKEVSDEPDMAELVKVTEADIFARELTLEPPKSRLARRGSLLK